MTSLVEILDIVIWPVTLVVVTMLLRKPISQLVPTLKKLKYKDLELEFEKEAGNILADAERDLPEPLPPPPKSLPAPKVEEPEIRFSRKRREPADEVMSAWRGLELDLRKLGERAEVKSHRSIRELVSGLESAEMVHPEAVKLIMRMASFRNKVAHSDEEVVSAEAAEAYSNSVALVREALELNNA